MKTTRRWFLQRAGVLSLAAAFGNCGIRSMADERPNILWLVAEDLCPDLNCYGEPLARTPHLDRFAGEGVRFTHAFTTAPVCSASRSAFMTGMYQTSIDAQNHRSHREDGYSLPDGVRLIPDSFRQAGYFTCNVTTAAPGVKGTGKTDFNFTAPKPFDGSDWNQRKPGQPFFAQINFPETHRNFERATENGVDPAQVKIPPYYPDHPITRRDWADYLDTVACLDEKVGMVLRRLEEDGLSENTVVVFMGDHGRPHVRGKQWLYDEGIHIPLMICWPGKLQAGKVCDDLVSAIDIPATLLRIAGIDLPPKMEGQVFGGPDAAAPREFIIAARDRCDETVDRIRCVRTKDFKYIRNFYPNRPYSQLNRYKERQYPVMRLMRRLHTERKLTPAQDLFMAPTRPAEELYDLRDDPDEIHNLAGESAFAETLQSMRAILDSWIERTGDRGAIPEDPAVIEAVLRMQKKNDDAAIKKLYQQEGMFWNWE